MRLKSSAVFILVIHEDAYVPRHNGAVYSLINDEKKCHITIIMKKRHGPACFCQSRRQEVVGCDVIIVDETIHCGSVDVFLAARLITEK